MKKLVIIHGVTGAIGSACLGLFASQKDTIVYGISRKAKDFKEFCVDGKLPVRTLICSISSETSAACMALAFTETIASEKFDQISYIHAVGLYPFEIDSKGNKILQYDDDKDGIDDRCLYLTKILFTQFCSILAKATRKPFHAVLFGGLADEHKPSAHTSWWKSIEKLKEGIVYRQKNGATEIVSLINISSVLCPNELITRPFVFTATDANPEYWLQPIEVAQFVKKIMERKRVKKFKEYSLFKKVPIFDKEYYEDHKFTPRKVAELYKK